MRDSCIVEESSKQQRAISSFCCRVLQKKINVIVNEKLIDLLIIACFHCYATFHTSVINKNFPFQNFAGICIAESCCFCKFLFDGKLQKYDISVKRKHSKSNETMIPSVFFHQFFVTRKLDFLRNGKFNEVFSARKDCVRWYFQYSERLCISIFPIRT